MKNKKQIIYIHGGETFKNRKDYLNFLKEFEISLEKKKRWQREYLDKELGKSFQIIRPEMPLGFNANYEDWKIWFEKYINLANDNVTLIGLSLGGIFLAKYLSENKFPKKILATFLICPPYNDTFGGFKLKSDLSLIEKNCKDVTLMFSKDDPVVPVSHAEKYRGKLKNSKIIIYKSKNGHFNIPKFPEIVKMIEEDIK